MAILLSDSQKKVLADIIPLSISIPRASALAFQRKTQEMFMEQLRDVKLLPKKFQEFKAIIEERYRRSKISPGESVGVMCAQSIGQMNTQMTLNSFHHAGISEAAMTAGVPKFQELLSVTKNPKIVNSSVYFINRPQTLDEIISACAGKLKCLSLKDVILSWNQVGGEKIEFEFNWKTLYMYGVYPSDVVLRLRRAFEDITTCVEPSSPCPVLIVSPILNDDTIDAVEYITDIVIPNILSVIVAGIPGVKDIFYEKIIVDGNEEWFARTVGSNYSNIMLMQGVDTERTTSNNIWDIYHRMGIEAARESLRKEFSSIMGGINTSHTDILVDRMTFSGNVNSISRYTLKSEDSSVLGKASFEESLENFIQASIAGTFESVTGNSASIVCGKKARAGTGFVSLRIDLDAIRKKNK
jgi:DNA-directed RNA polymerase subunit A"